MRLNNSSANRNTDAHIAARSVYRCCRLFIASGKNLIQNLLRNATPVVGNFKYGLISCKGNRQLQLCHSFRMKNGIFQKVQQHLLDKDRIHRNIHKVGRYLRNHLLIRVLLGELHKHRVNQFIQNDWRFHNLDLSTVDSCNSQQVFDHADKPLAILLNFSQQL